MSKKIAIIKLASIGDISIACRALSQYSISEKDELHWWMESHFIPLAQTLLQFHSPLPKIHFHGIDTKKLFQGNAFHKIATAKKLFSEIKNLRPDTLLLLHRDIRYRFLFLSAIPSDATLNSVSRGDESEYEQYSKVFSKVFPKKQSIQHEPHPRTGKRKIGILVGGGNNTKINYEEKKWPHFNQLIEELIQNHDIELFLFGSASDFVKLKENSPKIKNYIGKTSLEELPEIFSELDTFISIDSGLAHIAANVFSGESKKIITIFGPTQNRVWAPKSDSQNIVLRKELPCSPCNQSDGKFRKCIFSGDEFAKCMKLITSEDVRTEIFS